MRTWLFVGSLAAGVLLFVYELYCRREAEQLEAQHGNRRGGSISDEDFIVIDQTNPEEVKRHLGPNRQLPGPDDMCSICLEGLLRANATRKYAIIALPQCGHWFHQKCALRLLDYHPMCPICRVDIGPDIRNAPVRLSQLSEVTEGDNAAGGQSIAAIESTSSSSSPKQRRRSQQ